MIRVTIWNEFVHEQHDEKVKAVYPNGIHEAIAAFLGTEEDLSVKTATLEMPEHGLTQEVLDNTDVLLWWGHMRHGAVADEIVNRVHKRVYEGMGLIVLHSGHASKIFSKLMGTPTEMLRWREINEKQRIWTIAYGHPIAQGVGEYFELPQEETYGEHFAIPQPEELVFITWFPGGEVFRSGCCFVRGAGRIFYFQPGHESFPTYYNPTIQKVIKNAVRWAYNPCQVKEITTGQCPPIENI